MQNLEEKERKLRQTRSNFRTGNSDLDGKHLPERCSNSFRLGGRITTGTTYRPQNVYRNGVPVRSGTTTPLLLGVETQWVGGAVALPTVGLVWQTIHSDLPMFLNCIL